MANQTKGGSLEKDVATMFSQGDYEQIIKRTKRVLKKKKIPSEILDYHIFSLSKLEERKKLNQLISDLHDTDRIPIDSATTCIRFALEEGLVTIAKSLLSTHSLPETSKLAEYRLELALLENNVSEIHNHMENLLELIEDDAQYTKKWALKLFERNMYEESLEFINASITIDDSNIDSLYLKNNILENLYLKKNSSLRDEYFDIAKKMYSIKEYEIAARIIAPWADPVILTRENRLFATRLYCRENVDIYLKFKKWYLQRINTDPLDFKKIIDYEYTFGLFEMAANSCELFIEDNNDIEVKIVDIYVRALAKIEDEETMKKKISQLISKYEMNNEIYHVILKYLIEGGLLEFSLYIINQAINLGTTDRNIMMHKSNLLKELERASERMEFEMKIMTDEKALTEPFELLKYAITNNLFAHALTIIDERENDFLKHPGYLPLKFDVMKGLERITDAIKVIDEMLARAPMEISNLIRCSKNLSSLNIVERAFELADKAFQLDNHNVSAIYLLSDMAYQNGKWDIVLDANSKLISKGIINSKILERELFTLFKLNLKSEIPKLLFKVESTVSNTVDGQIILAIAKIKYLPEMDFRKHLRLAMLLSPSDKNTPLRISRTCLNANRLDLSIEYLIEAMTIDQKDPAIKEHANTLKRIIIDLGIDMDEIRNAIGKEIPMYLDSMVVKAIVNKAKQNTLNKTNTEKAIVVHQSHTLGLGGAERQVTFVLNALSSGELEGFEPHLLINNIPTDEKESYFSILDNSIPISEYEYDVNINMSDAEISAALAPWENIIKHLYGRIGERVRNMFLHYQRLKPNLAHLWQDWVNIYGGIAAIMAGIPKVILFARTLPPAKKGAIQYMRGRSYHDCYTHLLEMEHITLCHNSIAGKEEYAEWLEIDNDSIITVYNGTDFSQLDRLSEDFSISSSKKLHSIPEDAFVIGTVHRFVPEKQPWLWIDAAIRCLGMNDQLPKDFDYFTLDDEGNAEPCDIEFHRSGITPPENILKPFHFLLIGDGLLKESVEKMILEKGLSEYFHFVGSTNQIKGWLSIMDCFLLTSMVEGLPNVLIEAQGNSVPVISTDAGGSSETFVSGISGFTVDDSASTIADHILRIAEDNEWIGVARETAKRSAIEKFGLEAMISNVSNLYSGGE